MPSHDIGLLSTLVVSLVFAFAGGLAARTLHLPPLIGYLFAGVALGPFTPGVIANQDIASELAEIGVALLLFNIGMHFSFKDLLSVRKIAVPGAIFQVIATTLVGAGASALMLGTDFLASLMVGLALAIASTAVATRILEEKRQINAIAGRIALGWLVVQDILVILALVIFPILNTVEKMPSQTLAESLMRTFLQITGFVVVIGFGGRKLIPALLNHVARSGSREMFTLAVVVMALGIAYGSSMLFGVSLALGAFFAGIVIGESDLHHHAAAEALSMQQIFTILFFVSIGMLFDPRVVAHKPLEMIVFLTVIVLGTGFLTAAILFLMRVPLHAAALVGGSFAQIGEFSFVLSALGYQYGFYGPEERDLIVAVALLSIVLNPLFMSLAVKLARWAGETPHLARFRQAIVENEPVIEQNLGHAILVGCGRVGRVVTRALKGQGVPYVIIESDRILTEKLRREDETALVVYGDASREAVLAAAHPDQAKLLIITIPDFYHTRQIIQQAQRLNPKLDIVVRIHSDEEEKTMARMGISMIVMGEREIAFGLSYLALQKFGLEADRSREMISELRKEIYDPPAANPPPETPSNALS